MSIHLDEYALQQPQVVKSELTFHLTGLTVLEREAFFSNLNPARQTDFVCNCSYTVEVGEPPHSTTKTKHVLNFWRTNNKSIQMPPQQVGPAQPTHPAQRNEPAQASSGHDKAAKNARMSSWLNEKPQQEPWSAVARMHPRDAGTDS